MKHRKPIDLAKLRLLYEQNKTFKEIAKALNISDGYVYTISRHLGLPRRGRGLAACSKERRKEIASLGGKAVSANPEHMRAIGRTGGLSVSSDKEHMSRIGKKGGEKVSSDREHMTRLGSLGGIAKAKKDSE